jgi:hypothetical protein
MGKMNSCAISSLYPNFFGERQTMPFGRSIVVFGASIVFILLMSGPGNAEQAISHEAAHFDGPAELPRVYVKSSMADTPAPGAIREVKAGNDLQQAIDSAKCGETLKLEAGATFRGKFRFPQKPCDDAHWIVLRSGAPDSALPPEGTRITPCYAGVASLPGRPDFHCASTKNVMAKIVFDAPGDSGPILFNSGANHYRFTGLEITRARPDSHLRHLITTDEQDSAANHLIFDRIWLHGTPTDETKGGLHLSGIVYAALVDSYVSEFQCIALKGSCTDAQAVNGGTGDLPGGPYKIENNFLEASGENILFGGAAGSNTPADIEIRHNHFFKPLIWMPGQPGFVASPTGEPFIVKNHFELKNGERILFEGNILENCWGGFSQSGFSILLTPGNQGGHCPTCRVKDITIRYSKILHVGSGVTIANLPGKRDPGAAGGGHYSLHDLVFDDMEGKERKSFGTFLILLSRTPPVSDVRIDHITVFPTGAVVSIVSLNEKIKNFSLTNSIFTAGRRQIAGAGGGPENCAKGGDDSVTVLNNCFDNAEFNHNLIIGGSGHWPPGNIPVSDISEVGLRRFAEGNGGDYRLCNTKGEGCSRVSRAIKAGSDGKDLGADFDQLQKAIAGAE